MYLRTVKTDERNKETNQNIYGRPICYSILSIHEGVLPFDLFPQTFQQHVAELLNNQPSSSLDHISDSWSIPWSKGNSWVNARPGPIRKINIKHVKINFFLEKKIKSLRPKTFENWIVPTNNKIKIFTVSPARENWNYLKLFMGAKEKLTKYLTNLSIEPSKIKP